MRRLIIILILTFFVSHAVESKRYTIETVPRGKVRGEQSFVVDVSGVLSARTVDHINRQLENVETETSAEVSIVILPAIEGDVSAFAQELAQYWGVGKRQMNNGALWLYVVDMREMHISTGRGLEGVLPDGYLSGVLQERVFPYMRRGQVDAAFEEGVDAIFSRLMDESVRAELLLKGESPRVKVVDYIIAYFVLSLLVFVLYMWYLYYKIDKMRGDGNVQYVALGQDIAVSKMIGVVFFLPNFLLYKYLQRYRRLLREKPIDCHSCGEKMHLLSEAEEDMYLDKTKQCEEQFSSVDYDVWLCEKCASTRIIPYVNVNTSYSKCPACNARTYSLVSKRVLREASTYRDGEGREEYSCKNCGYTTYLPFAIPQIVVPPVVVIGGRGRGFGAGGSGFGGSGFGGFGGGGFDGGGAGGSF